MNKQLAEVMRRRGELQANIAMQRRQVAELGKRWQTALALADQGLAVMRFVRSYPILLSGVVALIVIRRSGLHGLLKSGWRLWAAYRSLTILSSKLPSGLAPGEFEADRNA